MKLNIGVGQRWILKERNITGLNLFYDNEWDAGHERMSVGGKRCSVGDFLHDIAIRYQNLTAQKRLHLTA